MLSIPLEQLERSMEDPTLLAHTVWPPSCQFQLHADSGKGGVFMFKKYPNQNNKHHIEFPT